MSVVAEGIRLAPIRGAAAIVNLRREIPMNRLLIAASLALAAGVVPQFAGAAGPFDGTWQVDAPQAGGQGAAEGGGRSGCEPLRLQIQVQDNRIQGSMRRSTTGANRVEQSTGRGSSPVTGTVAPDGTFNAQWESFRATGKFTGDKAEMHWNGSCGPRTAMGGRASATEGAGSTNR